MPTNDREMPNEIWIASVCDRKNNSGFWDLNSDHGTKYTRSDLAPAAQGDVADVTDKDCYVSQPLGQDKAFDEWEKSHAPDNYYIRELKTKLSSERAMHNAWRKRAEEAEATLIGSAKPHPAPVAQSQEAVNDLERIATRLQELDGSYSWDVEVQEIRTLIAAATQNQPVGSAEGDRGKALEAWWAWVRDPDLLKPRTSGKGCLTKAEEELLRYGDIIEQALTTRAKK